MTDLGGCEIAEHQTEKGPAGDLSFDERVGQYATIEVSENVILRISTILRV
jgi:hypothetical protein